MAHSAIIGSILGTAVGDAIGLPYEGLSRRRGVRLLGEPDRHRFFLRRGMVSDDTEHTCMVAQALIASGGDPDLFPRQLARRLRWWLLGVPAGIGRATLKATLKLWLGFSPRHSGVFSAGNGPAMRSAILGAAIDDLSRLRELVGLSTRITHTDPKAEYGALAVAVAAYLARRQPRVEGGHFLEQFRSLLGDRPAEGLLQRLEAAVQSFEAGQSLLTFAEQQGWKKGVSGYVYHTVPATIHAWLSHQQDFRAGVMDVIRCGGDTDTTAAIVGGILGAAVGKEGIPADWLGRLCEWPRTVAWMEQLGRSLERTLAAGNGGSPPPRLSAPGLFFRNGWFFLVVLGHVVRRCLPPY
jgi:ADP-ribosylglycohydrolase